MFVLILVVLGTVFLVKRVEFCLTSGKILRLLSECGEMTAEDISKQIRYFNVRKVLFLLEVNSTLVTRKKELSTLLNREGLFYSVRT
jgi:hypothetical protein